jgi:hypothetical protein
VSNSGRHAGCGGYYLEQLADQPGAVAEVFLNQLAADDAQEGGRCLVGHGLGQERLSGARRAVEDDALGRLDAHLLVKLWMQQRQLDRLAHFLNLLLQATDIRI